MSATRSCPQCGAPLPSEGWAGLCPKCLVRVSLGSQQENGEQGAFGAESSRGDETPGVEPETLPAQADILLERSGMVIGRYKLLQQIGEGGFGIVFMAEQQEPVQRKVALKIIKAGMDTREVIARFEAERQALALMDHPNIAQVLDGGTTTTGRPFFVMELVRGIPITDYCDQANLSTHERLELFIRVCRAVQHAHQKGVIHRDLKPSNVLVTLHDGEPVPKVIDFGVAKALGQKLTQKTLFTRFEQMIGTPAYMSPEQAALSGLDIDTRSDIYSLGVLLYELLTGVTPLDAETLRQGALDEIRRMIRETDPPKPSTRLLTLGERLADIAKHRHAEPAVLGRLLRGDLDWITMKALEKDRRRRYETVNGLAADIERHLRDQPVTARPPSALYRLQKIAQRHRVAFAGGAAVVFALVFGLAISIWQAVRATRAEREQSTLRKEAQNAQVSEATERQRVERIAAESDARLVRQYVADGNRLVDQGDLFGALPWLAEALKRESNAFDRTAVHRLRIGMTLRQCPTLARVWFHDEAVGHAEFTHGGRWVFADTSRVARLWNVENGEAAFPPFEHATGLPGFKATLSPDGQHLAIGSPTANTVGVWDLETGRPVFPPLQQEALAGFLFSGDGRRLVTGGFDITAQVWDAMSGQKVGPSLHHGTGVSALAFSPDGSLLATGSSTTVDIWEVATGKHLLSPLTCVLPGHNPEPGQDRGARFTCHFSPDGRRLAIGCGDGTASIYEVSSGKTIASVYHKRDVRRVAFSPDGVWLLTASDDGTAQVWDSATGASVSGPLKHAAPVFDANFSQDGRCVVTASSDATARVWDAKTGNALTPPLRHGGPVAHAAFGPDPRLVVTASDDHTARVWRWRNPELADISLELSSAAKCAAFSPDSQALLAVSLDGTAQVWDLSTGKAVPILNLVGIRHAQFSPDGKYVAVAGTNGAARVWELAASIPVSPALFHNGLVNHVEFDSASRRLFTASSDRSARIWDWRAGKLMHELKTDEAVNYVHVTRDGKRIVTVSVNAPILYHADMYERWSHDPLDREAITANWGQAQLWDADTGQALTVPRRLSAAVSEAAISPDGELAVPGCASRALTETEVWAVDLVRGGRMRRAIQHERGVIHPAFSPDGWKVVTASWDHTARVWDADTGEPISPPLRHEKSVRYAEFSSDSRLVATASEDHTARVWDAATGEPVSPPLRHRAEVELARFSPDAKKLLTSSADGVVNIWNVQPEDQPVEAEVQLAQFLAAQRIDETGALLPLSAETLQGAALAWRQYHGPLGESAVEREPAEPTYVPDAEAERQQAEATLQRFKQDSENRARIAVAFQKLRRQSDASSNACAEVIDLCSRAINFEPRGGGPYWQRGNAHFYLGHFREAINDIREYLWIKGPPGTKGEDSRAFLLRGQCYLLLGEVEKGEADFQTVLDSAPADATAFNNLAWMYVTGPTNCRSPQKALPLALKAVELGKTNSNELNTLGVVYYRLGQVTNAVTAFETGIKANKEGGTAYDFFFLAMSYQRLGKTVMAEATFAKAIKWLNEHPDQQDQEMNGFRTEAEEVLGKRKANTQTVKAP
jgi:WD40 repeat protein/serine/threonine protein kinase/tetratricopeptide (TPR) repeat protein